MYFALKAFIIKAGLTLAIKLVILNTFETHLLLSPSKPNTLCYHQADIFYGGHLLMWRKVVFAIGVVVLMFVDLSKVSISSSQASNSSGQQSLSIVNYTYDLNGNMLSDGQNCYDYNDANQLAEIRKCTNQALVAQYVYNHTGQRQIERIYEEGVLIRTVYTVGNHYETRVTNNGATTENTSYYWANNELIAKKNPDGETNFYHTDHLGSARVLSSANGNLIENIRYFPFGEIRSGNSSSKYLFTGQEFDTETALYYYKARYYNPALLRFYQPDWIVPQIYNPQLLNRYSYVGNNPLRYIDPTGNSLEDIIAEYGDLIKELKKIADFLENIETLKTSIEALDAYQNGDMNKFEDKLFDLGFGDIVSEGCGLSFCYEFIVWYIDYNVSNKLYENEPFGLLGVYDPKSPYFRPPRGCTPGTCTTSKEVLRKQVLEPIVYYKEEVGPTNGALFDFFGNTLRSSIKAFDQANRQANPWMYFWEKK